LKHRGATYLLGFIFIAKTILALSSPVLVAFSRKEKYAAANSDDFRVLAVLLAVGFISNALAFGLGLFGIDMADAIHRFIQPTFPYFL
jgi:hypothetical protein